MTRFKNTTRTQHSPDRGAKVLRSKARLDARKLLIQQLAKELSNLKGVSLKTEHQAIFPAAANDLQKAFETVNAYLERELSDQILSTSNSGNSVEHPSALMPFDIPPRNRRGRKSQSRAYHPLKSIRLRHNMTLEELSHVTGLSPSYLSRLESGSRRLNVDTMEKLSAALSCPPEAFLASKSKTWREYDKMFSTAPAPTSYSSPTTKTKKMDSAKILEKEFQAQSPPKIPFYQTKNNIINLSIPTAMITCPAPLEEIPGAFSLTMPNNTMSPRYRKGDRLIVQPGKLLTPECCVVVIMQTSEVIVGEFVGWRATSALDKRSLVANDCSLSKAPALELKIYTPSDKSRITSGEQLLLFSEDISSIARIVGVAGT